MFDALKTKWACLTCSTTFPVGEVICKPSTNKWHCPHCDSTDLSAADGETRELPPFWDYPSRKEPTN